MGEGVTVRVGADHPRRARPSLPPEFGLLELLAVLAAFLVPVVVLPATTYVAIVPKIAVTAPLGAVGLILLLRLAVHGDTAARLGLAFVAWCVLAAVVAPTPVLSLVGGHLVDRGALIVGAYVGCWALGRTVHPVAHPALLAALLAGAALNVVTGVVQVTVDLEGSWLASGERASGLTPSSVYLGAVCAGAMAGTAALLGRARSTRCLLLAAGLLGFFALGSNLSGSRAAIALGAMVALCAALLPGRRLGRAAVAGVAIAVGIGLGTLITSGATSATTRAVDPATGGVGPRVEMWQIGVEQWAERPLTGWGPGRFREATSPHISAEFAQAEGPGKLFFDAHNIVIEVLTTTGLPGLLLGGAFAWFARRGARGPLAWVAGGTAVIWLLEPVTVSNAATALLALGAAGSRAATVAGDAAEEVVWPPLGRWARPATVAAVVLGAMVGAAVIYAGLEAERGAEEISLAHLDRADSVYLADPAISDMRTQVLLFDHEDHPSDERLQRALRSARESIARDDSSETFWIRLGTAHLAGEDGRSAGDAFDEALERNPWSLEAWIGVAQAADAVGDDARVTEALDAICTLEEEYCVE